MIYLTDGYFRFNYTDIQVYANDMLNALFARISSHVTPEKVAENEYLMKCALVLYTIATEGALTEFTFQARCE